MLESEVRSNYFAELVERYNKRQRWLTWATLLASSGALASVVISLPDTLAFLRPLLTLAATAVSLASLVEQNQRRAIDAADLHLRWNKLSADYERLWENVYRDDAANVLEQLTERAADISKASTTFPNEPSALLRWEEHVVSQRLQPQA